jgi:hypothetical protein
MNMRFYLFHRSLRGVGSNFASNFLDLFGLWLIVCLALMLAGCGSGDARPTRTPFPTWTPTPNAAALAVEAVSQAPTAALPVLAATDTPMPEAPPPAAESAPVDTPTAEALPTPMPVAEPTPIPDYPFVLETAEKFPTEALAANMVRIYLYVYSPAELGLAGYTLRIAHNGVVLPVDIQSTAGLPKQTRPDPGPYTRFTNLEALFIQPQGGRWELQLLDSSGNPAGESTVFELTADEATRELYIRYRLK